MFATIIPIMDVEYLKSILNRFNDKKVIVIGDAILDCYVKGFVKRNSPEAPVPVIKVKNRDFRAGGAANVALNLHSLGAKPILFTLVGNDENGQILRSILNASSISDEGLFIDNERITTIKSRIFVDDKITSRIDDESSEYIMPEIEQKIVDAVFKQIDSNDIDLILFIDYDKGIITPSLFHSINSYSLTKNIPTAVDPKIRNFEIYRNITLFKPNFEEFLCGIRKDFPKSNIQMIQDEAAKMNLEKGFTISLISLAEMGIFMASETENCYFKSEYKEVADVTGAGDTVISVACLSLISGADKITMAKISNIAGGLVCLEQGVIPVDKTRLLEALKILNK